MSDQDEQRSDDGGVRNPHSAALADPRTTERYCQAIRAGAKKVHAAKFAGVTDRTVRLWKTLDTEHRVAEIESQYTRFFDFVDDALNDHVMAQLTNMQRAALGGNVRAMRWFLERAGYADAPKRIEVGEAGTWSELMTDPDAADDPPPEIPIDAHSAEDQAEDEGE